MPPSTSSDPAVLCMQATMLDGIFEGDVTITGDYAAVLYRLQLLGFNAIRVPFSFQVGSCIVA